VLKKAGVKVFIENFGGFLDIDYMILKIKILMIYLFINREKIIK